MYLTRIIGISMALTEHIKSSSLHMLQSDDKYYLVSTQNKILKQFNNDNTRGKVTLNDSIIN